MRDRSRMSSRLGGGGLLAGRDDQRLPVHRERDPPLADEDLAREPLGNSRLGGRLAEVVEREAPGASERPIEGATIDEAGSEQDPTQALAGSLMCLERPGQLGRGEQSLRDEIVAETLRPFDHHRRPQRGAGKGSIANARWQRGAHSVDRRALHRLERTPKTLTAGLYRVRKRSNRASASSISARPKPMRT